jgi:hypothetical protein
MIRLLTLAAVLSWVGAALAHPEMTVDLPGGATMDFVWIEPATFLMGASAARIEAVNAARRPLCA